MLPAATPRRLFLLGGLAIVFGIIASAWPVSTILTLVILWGGYALVDGVTMIVDALRGRSTSRGFSFLVGGISIVAGLVAIIHPFSSAASITWVLGLWLLVRGVAQVVEAFGHTVAGPKWLVVLAGIAYAVAGLLIMGNSGAAALSISVWLGFLSIMWGALLIGAGFALRSKFTAKQPTA